MDKRPHEIEDWPDDPHFDARLRWLEENSEDCSLLLMEKRRFDNYLQIIPFMKQGPKMMSDLCIHFSWSESTAQSAIKNMEKHGVVFNRSRDRFSTRVIYTIEKCPENILFRYPSKVSKIHLQ